MTFDTNACADLFSTDARYFTRLGSQDLCLEGRREIRDFLTHVPRQLHFQVESCTRDGPQYEGFLIVEGQHFARIHRAVRFMVERGLFKRFEMLPAP